MGNELREQLRDSLGASYPLSGARFRVRILSATVLALTGIDCAAIERRQYASITPVAAPPSGISHAGRSAELLRHDWPDASVEIRVLGSKGNVSFMGLLLPIIPLPASNFDGPSPWVYVTVQPRSADVPLSFDARAVILEAPNGRRYRPLLLTPPRALDSCDFGPFELGADSLARLARADALVRTPAFNGPRCFRVAFRLPPAAAPRYQVHIPRPRAGEAITPGAETETWSVCVRPRAVWEGDFMPFAPFFGPTWTFLRTHGGADFRDCPATPRDADMPLRRSPPFM